MKAFKYCVQLTDENTDREFWKTGLIISENGKAAEDKVYQYYCEKMPAYYVYPGISLTEINLTKVFILEAGNEF